MPDYIRHLEDPVYKMLVSASVRMLFNEPEIGNQLVSLHIFPDIAQKVPLRRKGHLLAYSRDLVKMLDPKELGELLRAATALNPSEPIAAGDRPSAEGSKQAPASHRQFGAGSLQLLEYYTIPPTDHAVPDQ